MTAQPGDILEVTVIHDNNVSGEQVNRYQFELDSAGPVDDADILDDIAEVIQTLYVLIYTIISVRNVFREVKVFNVTQWLLVGSTDANAYTGGGSADPSEPTGVASHVYFTTNVPKVILSKYIPNPASADLTAAGELNTAGHTALATFGAALLVQISGGANLYRYGYLSPKTLTFVVPSIMVASTTLAYQRRRKKGRGS